MNEKQIQAIEGLQEMYQKKLEDLESQKGENHRKALLAYSLRCINDDARYREPFNMMIIANAKIQQVIEFIRVLDSLMESAVEMGKE